MFASLVIASSLLVTAQTSAFYTSPDSATFHLPPLQAWQGQSEQLMRPDGPLPTEFELSNGQSSPHYVDTIAYLETLVAASNNQFKLETIGYSDAGREIKLLSAAQNGSFDNDKPTLLIQAGIHSGEIDGKDAGFMLLRDIAYGLRPDVLARVNLLFIPILNLDGHERQSRFNRINQRGPELMGFRSNGKNLNLNRDFTKLETPGVRAVIDVIRRYQPDLYLDVHVTDGADYQYDITFGHTPAFASDSPKISQALTRYVTPIVESKLVEYGHTPGPLVFVMNKRNLAEGLAGWVATPRFSNGFGDLANIPTILVENHSLKPYKQRVLGTYVLIDGIIDALSKHKAELRKAVSIEQKLLPPKMAVERTYSKQPDHINFKGIAYEQFNSELSGHQEVRYLGIPKQFDNLPIFWRKDVVKEVSVPVAYYLPKAYASIAAKLQHYGVVVERTAGSANKLTQLEVADYQFDRAPYEDRMRVTAEFNHHTLVDVDVSDYYKISTRQPLGKLIVHLLSPQAEDSYFRWGYFNSIFQRTEYVENYALIPYAEKMLAQQIDLKKEFEEKLNDPEFAKSDKARLDWLYRQTPFYDKEYLKYPVLIEYN